MRTRTRLFTAMLAGALTIAVASPTDASPLDDAVAAHRTTLDPKAAKVDRELAQLELAARLFELRLYQPSFAVFSAIADDPKHAAFERSLAWLAKLTTVLPEPADVEERIAKYDDRAIEAHHLEIYRGRWYFRVRQYDQAVRWFAKVSRDSRHYARAWFLAGVANVHLKRGPEAVAAWKRVAAAADREDAYEDDRLRDMALLAIARTYYSTKSYDAALEYWRAVDETGELWLDALYEQSWAYFMTGDHARALGNLHTLKTEFFANAWYPEADHLKSVIYLANCQYDDAKTLAARFHRRYAPIAKELRALPINDDEAAYRFTRDVRDGKAPVSSATRPAAETALSDRELLRHLLYVTVLDDEKKHFLRTPASLRDGPLGTDIKDALDLGRDVAIRSVGQLARERIVRAATELERLLAENAKILAADRADVGMRMPAGTDKNVVRGDDEHVIWPFTGEFWADEAGSYRQSIQSKCR